MSKGSVTFYTIILLILILPNTFGRFIFNLAGSLLVLSIIIPILIASFGWIAWKFIQSKANKCNACGATFFSDSTQCPICGSPIMQNRSKENTFDIPASDVTIDVIVDKSIE